MRGIALLRKLRRGTGRVFRGSLCLALAMFLAATILSLNPPAQAGPPARRIHSADTSFDAQFSLSELLRIVQFFNTMGYSCNSTAEPSPDGYLTGPGQDTSCDRHSSDYADPAWRIELSELLRAVQFFNMGGYHACPNDGTADGFCPGQFPNVVFILLDTTRADAVGGSRNGIPIMPFLDGFAREGIRFTNAIAPSSWTRPSMLSLETGLYPNAFIGAADTIQTERYVLGENLEIMPEWFASYGFDTWAWVTNDNCKTAVGYNQGYGVGRFSEIPFEVLGGVVVDAVLSSLATVRPPFYFYVHFVDSHGPYNPPAAYHDWYGAWPVMTVDDQNTLPMTTGYPGFRDLLRDLLAVWGFGEPHIYPVFTAGGVDAVRYLYQAETRYLDTQLERLVTGIRAQYPNTLFVITADHGEELLERGTFGHGYTMHQEVARVPFILHGPGLSPAVVDTPVSTLGMLPTIAGLLRLPPADVWQGQDMLTAPEDAPIFMHSRFNVLDRFDLLAASVRVGRFKLIVSNHDSDPELYDLATDPGEWTNVAAEYPDVLQSLEQALADHRAQYDAF